MRFSTVLLGMVLFLFDHAAAKHKHSCKGLLWAFYNNTGGPNHSTDYASFDPTAYKHVTPVYHSRTYRVGGDYANGLNTHNINIYGSKQSFNPNLFVLNHKGYIHAPQTGAYIFSISQVDDILLLWTGRKAFKKWTRGNADCVAAYNYPAGTNGSCTFTANYRKGQFVPIRLMYAQDDFPASAFISVTAPNGAVLLSPSTTKSKLVLNHGCKRKAYRKAPPFPPWGKE